ncbi:hypothetical protein JCM33374_g465 [Metschnikowia sp. JCM 33374]|nr:hypothetical protein JCM33374_g465 [Metschnikowia sp. JCM 33374]
MCSKQCVGITKKGSRCLIKVKTGEFCHHHVPTNSPTKTRLEPRHDFSKTNHQYRSPTISAPGSAPVTPKKLKSPTHVASKYYSTASNSISAPVSPDSVPRSPPKHATRVSGHIKYNNLDRPQRNSLNYSPTGRPIDYSSIPSSSKLRNSPKVEHSIQPGYIYVYTLASFLSKQAEGGWIQTRNLSRDKKSQDKWVDVDMRRSNKLLVKVGMTTKTPKVRIQQWESKCNHKLSCLYPGSHPHLGKSSLTKMISNLSLRDNAETQKYNMYIEKHQGFFVPRNVLHCEQQIHMTLKKKFGRGEIHCTGCSDKHHSADDKDHKDHKPSSILDIFRSKESAAPKADYNIHNEWFPIPRKGLDEVFSIINSECMKYRP